MISRQALDFGAQGLLKKVSLGLRLDRYHASSDDFCNVVRAKGLDEALDLLDVGGLLNDNAGWSGPRSSCDELIDHVINSLSLFFSGLYPDKSQLALDADLFGKILALNDVDQLVELLQALANRGVVSVYDESESAKPWIFAITGVEAGEGESAATEQ